MEKCFFGMDFQLNSEKWVEKLTEGTAELSQLNQGAAKFAGFEKRLPNFTTIETTMA